MLNANEILAKLKATLPNVTTEKSRSCFSFFCCNEKSETFEEKLKRSNQQKFNLIATQVAQKLAEGKDVVSSDFTVVSTNKVLINGSNDKTPLLSTSINAENDAIIVACQQSEPCIENTNDEESKKRNLELFVKALYLFSLDHENNALMSRISERLKAQFPHVITPLNTNEINEILLVEFCKNNIGVAIFGAKNYSHHTLTNYGAVEKPTKQLPRTTSSVSVRSTSDLNYVGSYYKPAALGNN